MIPLPSPPLPPPILEHRPMEKKKEEEEIALLIPPTHLSFLPPSSSFRPHSTMLTLVGLMGGAKGHTHVCVQSPQYVPQSFSRLLPGCTRSLFMLFTTKKVRFFPGMWEGARSVRCTNLWRRRGKEKRGSKRKEKEEEEGKACLLHCAEVRNNREVKIFSRKMRKVLLQTALSVNRDNIALFRHPVFLYCCVYYIQGDCSLFAPLPPPPSSSSSSSSHPSRKERGGGDIKAHSLLLS